MQTRAAQAVTTRVPAMSGSTPKDAGSKSGAQSVPVRKSTIEISPKNSNAGAEERDDDPDSRRHGHESAEGEDDLDDVLAPAPA